MSGSKRSLAMALCCLCLLMSGNAYAEKSKKEKQCQKTRASIEKIQKKMRAGYDLKKSEKYHRQLNELYKKEFKHCI